MLLISASSIKEICLFGVCKAVKPCFQNISLFGCEVHFSSEVVWPLFVRRCETTIDRAESEVSPGHRSGRSQSVVTKAGRSFFLVGILSWC